MPETFYIRNKTSALYWQCGMGWCQSVKDATFYTSEKEAMDVIWLNDRFRGMSLHVGQV